MGGTPRGRSSTREQRDNCPTLTSCKYFSPVAHFQNFNQCVHPEVPTAQVLILYDPPPPLLVPAQATSKM